MEIDDDIESVRAQPADERPFVSPSREAREARRDHQLIDVGIAVDDWCGRRLDEIGDGRVREALSNRPDCRRREHDVADLAQPNQEICIQSAVQRVPASKTGQGLQARIAVSPTRTTVVVVS